MNTTVISRKGTPPFFKIKTNGCCAGVFLVQVGIAIGLILEHTDEAGLGRDLSVSLDSIRFVRVLAAAPRTYQVNAVGTRGTLEIVLFFSI